MGYFRSLGCCVSILSETGRGRQTTNEAVYGALGFRHFHAVRTRSLRGRRICAAETQTEHVCLFAMREVQRGGVCCR